MDGHQEPLATGLALVEVLALLVEEQDPRLATCPVLRAHLTGIAINVPRTFSPWRPSVKSWRWIPGKPGLPGIISNIVRVPGATTSKRGWC